MRRFLNLMIGLFAALTVFFVLPARQAIAGVFVKIDRVSQVMDVYVNGYHRYSWAISTGRRGYATPAGIYRPTRLERVWHSRKYDWSPMPYSIFFRGGYAIHGTYETKHLGRRASHGCIRLAPHNASQLFSLVRSHGTSATRIQIR
jgi:lipoprotein-anchoring transpeptidase ErfK/SrfK